MESDVKDRSLALKGTSRIEWADRDMPILRSIRARFEKEQPLAGVSIGACLHVTAETANLMRTLKAGGASVYLCASNPLSTQDDIAAALGQEFGIPTFAIRGEDKDTFFSHIEAVIALKPNVTMDDGADLISAIHANHPDRLPDMIGGTEETTTGVVRLRAMEAEGALRFPVVAVNDAKTKNLFDNRFGTGQSTLEAIVRATGRLLAGQTFVVAGYGWCGKGLALRARGMGSNVIITEVDPVKALEAAMEGFRVMPMKDAAREGDIFCTVTGNINVIGKEHFETMKDGAVICNAGHFDVEVNVEDLRSLASGEPQTVHDNVQQYAIGDKRILLLAEGRLVNLAAAEGHPASVMDMSFSTQALSVRWIVSQKGIRAAVYDVPDAIEEEVARLKLASMGKAIDALTEAQKKYLRSWQHGT